MLQSKAIDASRVRGIIPEPTGLPDATNRYLRQSGGAHGVSADHTRDPRAKDAA